VDLPGVDGGLHARVVEPGPRPDHRPAHVDGHRLALAVEIELPQHRRAWAVRQQAGGVFGQHRRVQRHGAVGQVHGLPATAHLGVQRRARHDDGAEVGDGVVHAEAGAGADHPERLVEVLGPRRVDRHQLDVRGVETIRTRDGADSS
jgi:hypothetical protein